MQIVLVFLHGWGFDKSYFKDLSQCLASYPQVHWDLGYFSKNIPSLHFPKEEICIGIGHSFGFHHLLNFPFKGLVSLAGFTHFCSYQSSQHGTSVRVLTKMLHAFEKNTDAVLKEFWRQCGIDKEAPQYVNHKRLAADLRKMRDLDEHQALMKLNIPLLSIYGEQDKIVPSMLSHDSFKQYPYSTMIELLHSSHALGYKEADKVAYHIGKWIEDVVSNSSFI